MIYAATPSESQGVMCWRLILKYFGTNIKHTSGVDNIGYYRLSTFPNTPSNKYNSCKSKTQCRVNELFAIGRV